MIGQYLLNINEIDTIYILQNILQVNKAYIYIYTGDRSEGGWAWVGMDRRRGGFVSL